MECNAPWCTICTVYIVCVFVLRQLVYSGEILRCMKTVLFKTFQFVDKLMFADVWWCKVYTSRSKWVQLIICVTSYPVVSVNNLLNAHSSCTNSIFYQVSGLHVLTILVQIILWLILQTGEMQDVFISHYMSYEIFAII